MMNKIPLLLVFLLPLLLPQACFAWQFPRHIDAGYEVLKYNMTIGEMKLALDRKNGELHYSTNTTPLGFARWFTSDEVSEASTLQQQDDNSAFKLVNYQYTQKETPRKNQSIAIRWDHNTALISTKYKKKTVNLQHTGLVWDRLSVQLSLMQALNNNPDVQDSYHYSVVENGQVSNYVFKRIGEETIEIEEKEHATLRFERDDGKRLTILWLSPALDYLPIRMEQHQDDELLARVELRRSNIQRL